MQQLASHGQCRYTYTYMYSLVRSVLMLLERFRCGKRLTTVAAAQQALSIMLCFMIAQFAGESKAALTHIADVRFLI